MTVKYTDPDIIDIATKGDDDETELVTASVNRNSNRGRKQRYHNNKKKDEKRKRIISIAADYTTAGHVCDKGYIQYPKNSNRVQYIKKQTSHKARQSNRNIDDEDPAEVARKGKGYIF